MTQTLIGINVAVFLIQLFNGAELMRLDSGWIYENGVLVDRRSTRPASSSASPRATGGVSSRRRSCTGASSTWA